MSDLEEKGYLYAPHTSAGRVPTDMAYRLYVDSLLNAPVGADSQPPIARSSLNSSRPPAALPSRQSCAAQHSRLACSLRSSEWRLGRGSTRACCSASSWFVSASERLVLVLTLQGGAVRQMFVEVGGRIADNALAEVSRGAQRKARRT